MGIITSELGQSDACALFHCREGVSRYLTLSSHLHPLLAFRLFPCLFSKGLEVKDVFCQQKINAAFVLHKSIYVTEMLPVLTWLAQGEEMGF